MHAEDLCQRSFPSACYLIVLKIPQISMQSDGLVYEKQWPWLVLQSFRAKAFKSADTLLGSNEMALFVDRPTADPSGSDADDVSDDWFGLSVIAPDAVDLCLPLRLQASFHIEIH